MELEGEGGGLLWFVTSHITSLVIALVIGMQMGCPLNCSYPNGLCVNGTCICNLEAGYFGQNCSSK